MASQLAAKLWRGREAIDRVARHAPARLAILVFGGVILLFTGLLSLPMATASGERADFIDALFTATSAVCVTGLVTVPTGVYWSTFGQAIIIIAVKIGGLGVMTLASILGLAVSRRLGLTARLMTASETKTTRLGEVGSLIRVVIITSTTLEVLLAVLLAPRFLYLHESPGEAAWHSIFYAISAFNNAGFVPTAEGLTTHYSDWMLLIPIMLGMFVGSLGFPVILNVARNKTKFRRWSLHAKLTVTTSALLVLMGSLWFTLAEWSNPATLGSMNWADKLLNGAFLGVMPRSGGMSTIDIGSLNEASWLVTDALMFVGGGSASTAGGIKVSTLAVLMLAIVAEARGDKDTDAFGFRIPRDTLRQAVAVTFVGATTILVACLILLRISGFNLDVILFEVISAFGTVGLSTGITDQLPVSGQYVLVALMFVGRVGTMTLGAALALRSRRRVIRLPEERPIIG